MTDHPPASSSQPGSTNDGKSALADIGRAVGCYLGVESGDLPADVRRLVDRCAAAEAALAVARAALAEAERIQRVQTAQVERVRAAHGVTFLIGQTGTLACEECSKDAPCPTARLLSAPADTEEAGR